MLYFPQLSSGALAQYPLAKQSRMRTIENTAADGRMFKSPAYGSSERLWELRHLGMTDSELLALTTLFEATEGRLQSFTFLDPVDNLLLRSEDLSEAWDVAPLLQITSTEDPFGTSRGLRLTNTGAGEQSIEQTIAAPGWYQYCFSFYARSTGGGAFTLTRSAGGQLQSALVEIGATWKRVTLSGKFSGSDEMVTFGVRLPAGLELDIFGFQVDPQISPSAYKATTTRSGVHPGARFTDDTLRITSHHLNQHTAAIGILVAGN